MALSITPRKERFSTALLEVGGNVEPIKHQETALLINVDGINSPTP